MNYYQILGVKEDASPKEIKTAYKKLIKKYHPDIYSGDKTFAKQKTQEINSAYDILSNEAARKEYDLELHPSTTYEYTPPKYNNPESYNYNNYYKTSEYDNNYRRYTDYHRSKTPNSNYSETQKIHDEFSNNVISSFSKISFKNKILILIIFIAIYFVFLITSFLQFNSLFKGESTGPLLNTHKKDNTSNNTVTITIPNEKNNPSNIEDFDINDYIPENELIKIYHEYYSDKFNSYSDFKESLSNYLYYYYFNEE